uniref:Small ribosomal subunit protein uS3c n=1 Tax=Nephroselmis pyriformis TaxID=156128 RepID=A0A8A2H8B6_9CHLO|nr:ribosomal protein S3 [Nephroselmis pyriformis]QSV37283.1 ribosomal protein S3 [Nephroselmis pyriformis]
MGQKIHPLGFRLGITQDHRSTWFAKPSQYAVLVKEDKTIRQYVHETLPNGGITQIGIARTADCVSLSIETARPGLLVGRNSEGLETLRKGLAKKLNYTRQISVEVLTVQNADSEAQLIADNIAEQLEKRVAFRRAVRQTLKKAKFANLPGIKIQVSGRLNGAEIARTEWAREGRVPLHTLRADIDYCSRTAQTIYGVLGIKVWVFRGEKKSFT